MNLEIVKVVKSSPQDEATFSGMWRFYCAKSSFSNDDPRRLEDHFEKRSEDFVPDMSKNNNLFIFIQRHHGFGEMNPSLSPNFHQFSHRKRKDG